MSRQSLAGFRLLIWGVSSLSSALIVGGIQNRLYTGWWGGAGAAVLFGVVFFIVALILVVSGEDV